MCTPHAIITRGKHIQRYLFFIKTMCTRPYRSAKTPVIDIYNTCSVFGYRCHFFKLGIIPVYLYIINY
jgi:hypothetical protein